VARPIVTRMVTIELPWMDLQRVLSQDPLNPDTTAEKENIILHRAGATPRPKHSGLCVRGAIFPVSLLACSVL
jgi:hypothetical protein